jgi:hypothetical protein
MAARMRSMASRARIVAMGSRVPRPQFGQLRMSMSKVNCSSEEDFPRKIFPRDHRRQQRMQLRWRRRRRRHETRPPSRWKPLPLMACSTRWKPGVHRCGPSSYPDSGGPRRSRPEDGAPRGQPAGTTGSAAKGSNPCRWSPRIGRKSGAGSASQRNHPHCSHLSGSRTCASPSGDVARRKTVT